MQTSDFDYNLPEELIAQIPLKDRSSSRLLVVDKKTGNYEDRHFSDILDYLNRGDALVLNETKVLPARIIGLKPETGGVVEILLLKNLENDTWECLARPQKRLKKGTRIVFGFKNDVKKTQNTAPQIVSETDNKDLYNTAPLTATVLDILEDGITHVHFNYRGIFLEILEKLGTMPLPPYIHKQLKDQSRYQTVYAKNLGSAAAPTAGLHFTPKLLEKAKKKGIEIIKITLHVGLGTFRPVQTEDLKKHVMHTESYNITEEAAAKLNDTRRNHGKIFAVGTTTVRTLESNLKNHNKFTAETAETDIFIYPGYQFKAVDSLITNFHLPKSTLLMLVSAFCGTEKTGRDIILKAYRHAIEEKYRFFSFGDAMLITEQK